MENTAKKTAYIHIGMPKTGSSAIRSTLLRFFNEGKLRKFDMQYFHFGIRKQLKDFVCTGDSKYFIEQTHKMIQVHSIIGEKNLIVSDDLLTTVFLSGRWGFRYDLLPLLAQAFNDYNIKVIVYLRRQDLLIESRANEHAKGAHNTLYNNANFNYKELIDRCLECFKGGVIVRKYERESLYMNDSVTDFLHAIGLDELIDDYTKNKGKNTLNSSLSPRAFKMAIADNQQYLLNDDEIESRVKELEKQYKDGVISRESYIDKAYFVLWGKDDRINLNGRIRTNLLKGKNANFSMGSSSYGFLSPEERAKILAQYAEDNAAVAREYFGQEDGKLFNDKMPKEVVDINSEPSVTDVIQTFMPILIDLTQCCEELKLELKLKSKSPLSRFAKRIREKIRKIKRKFKNR